jgi:hypothetical protein
VRTMAPRRMLPLGMLSALSLSAGLVVDAEAALSGKVSGVSAALAAVAPAKPTGLKVVSVGDKRVSLDWADNAPGYTRYQVYRNDKLIANGPTASAYVDTAVANGTTYTYRVSAGTQGAYSAWTATVSATPKAAPAAPVVPAVPSGLKVTGVSSGTVKLDWNDNAPGFTRYQVYRDGALIADGPTASEYTASGLTNGRSYAFRVSAGTQGAYSAWTAAVSATPAAASTPAPTTPSAPATTAPAPTSPSSSPSPVFSGTYVNPLFSGDLLAGAGYGHQASGPGNTASDVLDPAGSGGKVIRLQTNENGGDGSVVRSQIIAPKSLSKGTEYWQVARVYIDPNLPTNGAWMTIMSSYGAPFNGASPSAIRILGNRLTWQSNGRNIPGGEPWSVPLVKGKWLAIARHEKLSAGSDGFMEVAYSPDANNVPMTLQTLKNGKTRWNFPTIDASNSAGPYTLRLQNYHKDNQPGWSGTYSTYYGKHRVWPANTTLTQLNSVYIGK